MQINSSTVKGAVEGDVDCQRAIYDQLKDRVMALVRRIVGRDDCEDVTQNIFYKVFLNLDRFQQNSNLATWIFRITYNESIQHLRSQKQIDGHSSSIRESMLRRDERRRSEIKDLVDNAMSLLDESQRVILQLREIEKLSYEEIAEILSIPIGTVGSRLTKARWELKTILEKMGWEGHR